MVRARALLLGALACGLVAASLGPPLRQAIVLAAGMAAAPATGLRPRATMAAVLATLAGFGLGAIREQALAPAPVPAYLSGARATLLEAPRQERFGWRALVGVGRARLVARGAGARPAWAVGDLLHVRGAVRPPKPGERWLSALRSSGVLDVAGARVVGRRGGVAGALDAIRRRALAAIAAPLPPAEAALLQGMVLGDDAAMAPGQREQMRRTGLGHIVAASGSNVALLAGLVAGACGLAGLGRRSRLLAAGAAIVGYALLCGGGPSIVRATVMGVAALAAALASRPAARGQALLLAAVVTLAADPGSWRGPGWQLSFAAVAGIALLAGPLHARLSGFGWPAAVAEPVAMTVAATIATAPVAAAAFGSFSPASLPANVLAGPLVAPATWLGMVGAAAGQLDPGLAWPVIRIAGLPAAGIVALARWLSSFPWAQVGARAAPVAGLSTLGAATLAGLLKPALRRPAVVAAALALTVLGADRLARSGRGPGPPPGGGTRITFLDIGQGDATLFQSRGESLLVDAGPDGGPVVARLREAGVSRLGALLVTHAQADHLGGADRVIAEIGVGSVIDGRDGVPEPQGREMEAAARARDVPLVAPRAGDRLRVGDLTVRVLGPSGPPLAGGDPNLRCVVLRVDGPGISMLLAGDAESGVLAPLHPGPVRVLKVSHHGSADPGLPALLRELRPELAVIEVGSSNPYGHPAPETLASLAESGARVMRTDRDGSVRVDAGPGALRVQAAP